MTPVQIGENALLYHADCRDVLRSLADNSIDSVVTDPPYALVSIVKRFGKPGSAPAKGNDAYMRASAGFMSKTWDNGETAFSDEFWAEVLRVLKPGGHVVSFSGTRTYHRMACAIEDAGFEIRDQLGWLYGSGFPKSHDVSKGIDRAAGAEREVVGDNPNSRPNMVRIEASVLSPRVDAPLTTPATPAAIQWQGWGTALKPAWEPICLARKPLSEPTVAANVLKWGTGALNIDGCRVEGEMGPDRADGKPRRTDNTKFGKANETINPQSPLGRWPANIVHDGSDEVVACFPDTGAASGAVRVNKAKTQFGFGDGKPEGRLSTGPADNGGSAARYFYCAKASRADRDEGLSAADVARNTHPTVKPTALMQWLCRLVTPPGGTVLDPFTGSGSTGKAALREGFKFVGCEREDEYVPIATARIASGMLPEKKAKARPAAKPSAVNDNVPDLFGFEQPAKANGGGRTIYGKFADQQPGWRNNGR